MEKRNIKAKFVKSVLAYDYDEVQPTANEEHRGKVSYVQHKDKKGLLAILPCGHLVDITEWNLTDIDTDHPSATPSIFCHGLGREKGEHNECWHGYLTNGEFTEC